MTWSATIGGDGSPAEERKIASELSKLMGKFGFGGSFWTHNEPIDLAAQQPDESKPDEVKTQAPQVPPEAPKEARIETHKATAKKAAKK